MSKLISLFIISLVLFYSTNLNAQTDTFNVNRAPFKKLFYNPDPDEFDVRLFRSANSYRTGVRDLLIPIIDKTMLPGSFILPLSFYLYGRASDKWYEEQTGFLMATALFTNAITTFAMKTIINRKRPYVALSNVFYEGDAGFDVFSFPSGHTSTMFTMCTMLALRYPKHPQYYLPVYAWAAIVAYGRMYMGMHYPIDLTVGAAIGSAAAVITYAFRKELLEFKNYLTNETKPDENKSIDLALISFSLLSSTFINEYLGPKIGKGKLDVSPSVNENGLLMNLSYQF